MKILSSVLMVSVLAASALADVDVSSQAEQKAKDSSSARTQSSGDGSGVFVGLEGSAMRSWASFNTTTTSLAGEQKGSFKDGDWNGSLGLKVGYYFDKSQRIYFNYQYAAYTQMAGSFVQNTQLNSFTNGVDATFTSHRVSVGYDYIYNLADEHNLVFGAYAGYGANVGKFFVTSETPGGGSMTLDPRRFTSLYHSLFAGVNVGYLYNLKIDGSYFGDIEVGMRLEYLASMPSSKTINVITNGNKEFPSTQKGSLSAFNSGLYVGYSYKF